MTTFLRWVSLAAALVVAATFEYSAGKAVGLGWAAWAVPVMVDSYAVSAIVTGRDVRAALTLLAGSVTTGSVHKAVTQDGAPAGDVWWVVGTVTLAVLVAAFATGVVWRVDVLFRADAEARRVERERAEAVERAAREAEARARAVPSVPVTSTASVPSVPAKRAVPRGGRDEVGKARDRARRAEARARYEAGTLDRAGVAEHCGISVKAAGEMIRRWERAA